MVSLPVIARPAYSSKSINNYHDISHCLPIVEINGLLFGILVNNIGLGHIMALERVWICMNWSPKLKKGTTLGLPFPIRIHLLSTGVNKPWAAEAHISRLSYIRAISSTKSPRAGNQIKNNFGERSWKKFDEEFRHAQIYWDWNSYKEPYTCKTLATWIDDETFFWPFSVWGIMI